MLPHAQLDRLRRLADRALREYSAAAGNSPSARQARQEALLDYETLRAALNALGPYQVPPEEYADRPEWYDVG